MSRPMTAAHPENAGTGNTGSTGNRGSRPAGGAGRAASPMPAKIRLGIIAGGGSLPLEIARSVIARGGDVHVVMIEGQAQSALRAFPHTDAKWSEVGKAIKAFKRAGISDIVLVGRMVRPRLRTVRPDLGFITSLPLIVKIFRGGGDDAVLRAVIAMFERKGLKVRGVDEVAPELLVGEGALTDLLPAPADEVDIVKGFELIAALGRHDIGQAVIVSRGRIDAIEGAEGTDRMVERVAKHRRDAPGDPLIRSRGVLIKRPKPGQDLRVDLPTIGPETVRQASEARLAGIAVMSGHVLAANRIELIHAAERDRVFVVGLPDEGRLPHTFDTTIADGEVLPFGRHDPSPAAGPDIRRGIAIQSTLAHFGIGTAVVIRKGRVLAVGCDEPATEVIARATDYYRPGRTRLGVAVIGHREAVDEQLIETVSRAGLEGLVIMYGREVRPQHKGAIAASADRHDVFIAGAEVLDAVPA